ncbi:MAG: amidohydrolase family protein [Phycisphaerae bacterium]
MIIDCNTHIWSSVDQLGSDARAYLRRQSGREEVTANPAEHAKASECVNKALVFGYVSDYLGAEIPNDFIADYVANHPQKMIGVAAVDPARESEVDRAAELLDRPEFRGLTVSPSSQNFHPANSSALKLYELAEQRGVPVFIHQGTHFAPKGSAEFGRPLLLDEIARDFPQLTIVISALGHPWIEEGIALIGKHERVFADIAGLIRRPWQAYNSLVLAHQFNVMEKVLFGSDFPYLTAADAIKSVYRLHEVTQGTNLPSVPREILRTMIERNSLESLGIMKPGEADALLTDEDEELQEEIN